MNKVTIFTIATLNGHRTHKNVRVLPISFLYFVLRGLILDIIISGSYKTECCRTCAVECFCNITVDKSFLEVNFFYRTVFYVYIWLHLVQSVRFVVSEYRLCQVGLLPHPAVTENHCSQCCHHTVTITITARALVPFYTPLHPENEQKYKYSVVIQPRHQICLYYMI